MTGPSPGALGTWPSAARAGLRPAGPARPPLLCPWGAPPRHRFPTPALLRVSFSTRSENILYFGNVSNGLLGLRLGRNSWLPNPCKAAPERVAAQASPHGFQSQGVGGLYVAQVDLGSKAEKQRLLLVGLGRFPHDPVRSLDAGGDGLQQRLPDLPARVVDAHAAPGIPPLDDDQLSTRRAVRRRLLPHLLRHQRPARILFAYLREHAETHVPGPPDEVAAHSRRQVNGAVGDFYIGKPQPRRRHEELRDGALINGHLEQRPARVYLYPRLPQDADFLDQHGRRVQQAGAEAELDKIDVAGGYGRQIADGA